MPSSKRDPLVGIAIALAITASIVVVNRMQGLTPPALAAVPASGYGDLLGCRHVSSFDGKRVLTLHRNARAEIVDQTSKPFPTTLDGTWQVVDASAHKFRIVMPGLSGVYTRVEAPGTCILTPGDADSISLRRSWFSAEPVPVEAQAVGTI